MHSGTTTSEAKLRNAKMKVYRGEGKDGSFKSYTVPVEAGMVVLDAIHYIQREIDPDLAVRWNCKAAKCGSCSAEVNGRPSLMCKTRMEGFAEDQEIEVQPLQTFPIIRDLVCDVSWNFEQNKRIKPFTPKPDADWTIYQEDIERVQEFRKCIECFLCQNVCHILRENDRKDAFVGPRFMIRVAGLEMHPLDSADRLEWLHEEGGVGMCNITKCCTEVCPEDIHITDNGIIPMKERIVDEYYDPVAKFLKRVFRR